MDYQKPVRMRGRMRSADEEPGQGTSRPRSKHRDINAAVLAETAKLHAGDVENRRLWQEFLPVCRTRSPGSTGGCDVTFDHTLGESFYEDRLAGLVEDLLAAASLVKATGRLHLPRRPSGADAGAQEGRGVSLRHHRPGHDPLSDGDVVPDAILYVVDHRQSLHFQQLFAAARLLGYHQVEFEHVSFGTVLGDDGRPFKTRSGDTVGLEGLLDEAVRRALQIVSDNDDAKPDGPELSDDKRRAVAESVGIAALKYADLSQNRTSDYVFSYDKMLAMNGNTATYMQYAYARVRSIFAKGNVDVEALRAVSAPILLGTPAERALAWNCCAFPRPSS